MVIALTGGAGAGKSTAARYFEGLGAAVVDLDDLGREVLEEPDVRDQLAEAYGVGILDHEGLIDRARLAEAAFVGPHSANRLDEITHPRILRRLHAELDEITADGIEDVVVVEIPLLNRVPSEIDRSDAVVAIEAPVAVRVERLVRRGLTEADARRRIAVQATDEERRALATAVVVNDADEATFQGRLGVVWSHLVGPIGIGEGWYVEESKSS